MERRFLDLLCIGCIACAFTACSDDDNNGIDPIEGGQIERVEDAVVELRLSQTSPGTYAYNGYDDATDEECQITGPVRVFVFDDQGVFEKDATLTVTKNTKNDYISQEMKISSGDKYLYVFANMTVATPGTGEYRKNFEKRILNAAVAAITKDDEFYIGTLEPKSTTVKPSTELNGSTQSIPVQVGRLAAKVTVKDTPPTVEGDLKRGTFDFADAQYRVINEAEEYYLVGQSSLGISAPNPGNYMVSPHFTATWPINTIIGPANTWTGVKPVGESFYTTENTHTNPMNGSATSVQYRVKYTPAAEDVYDLDGNSGQSLTNGDFWMASVGDLKEKYIFNADPEGETIPVLGKVDDDTIVKYEGGYSYYIIPITDKSETEPAAKYSVIRNHSYILTLSTIARLGLGDPDDITDPELPIEDDVDIKFIIEVLDWFKVEQEVNL